jgi:hypothetical protein
MTKEATKPDVSGNKTFDTNPAAVETWIAALPVANLGETSRRLYSALVDLNQQSLQPRKRVGVLEQLNEYVKYTSEAMKKHFVGKRFPLDTKDYRVARLAQALSIQLAIGYQTAAFAELEASGYKAGKSLAPDALNRALMGYETTLLRTYQVYASYPRGLWRRINKLYAAAEAYGFENLEPESEGKSDIRYSIASIYKRLLLLALACPYRLRQPEIEHVDAFIKGIASQCRFSGLEENPSPNGIFVVDLDSDNPPSYYIASEEYDQESCRLLHTTQLADIVHDHLQQASSNKDSKTGNGTLVSQPVLRRLMLGWGVMPNRRSVRNRKHLSVLVASGLSAAHYFISGEVTFSEDEGPAKGAEPGTLFETKSHFESKPLKSQQKVHVLDVWQIGGERPEDVDHNHLGMIDFEVPGKPRVKPAFAKYRMEKWNMVDSSAGGYRLLWEINKASDAQVGELLGIRKSDDTDEFDLVLGAVRWIKGTPKQGVELGVEILSPGAVAVAIRLLRPDGSCGQYTRALLLPANETDGQPETLITPTVPYRSGDRIVVNIDGKETQAELGKLVENTGCVAQFQFTTADIGTGTLKDSDPSQAEPEDFDTLWGSL